MSRTVAVDFGEPTTVNGYRIGPNGQLQLLRNGEILTPQRAWSSSHREKVNGGERPLVRIPIPPEALQFGATCALKHYDRIFAIDTNTKPIGDLVVSVSCFSGCRFLIDGHDEVFEYVTLGLFAFHDGPVPKCENFAWHVLIQMIQASPDYKSDKRYAIVTDSDLGRHEAYNDRSEPYLGKYKLPDNFTLIYATDKGSDLTNQVIKLCDQEAGKMWKQMEIGVISLSEGLRVADGWCTKLRGWVNGNGQLAKAGWFRLSNVPLAALSAHDRGEF